MITTNKDNLSQAVSKSSSLGLAGGIAILLSNLLLPIVDYLGLPDFLFRLAPAFAVVSFALLALCFSKQRKAIEDRSTKKSVGYVMFGCILATAADFIFLVHDILFFHVVNNGKLVFPDSLLMLCDLLVIAAFILITYYFILLKRQKVFSDTLNTVILIAIIAYIIKTVVNLYGFVVSILEKAEVVQSGVLVLPYSITDPVVILISIPLVLFFAKAQK